MIVLTLYGFLADHLAPWLVQLATRALSRSLNMPEPLVHSAGVVVVARVLAFEHSVGRRLCPARLAARWGAWLRHRS